MNIHKTEPHPLLLGRMLGPQVHKDFVNDGCSSVPDLYLKWPCLIHDWQYWQLRRAWEVIEWIQEALAVDNKPSMWGQFEASELGTKQQSKLESIGVQIEYPGWDIDMDSPDFVTPKLIPKQMIIAHEEYRQLADKYLRANIKTLTRLKVKDGQIKRRSIFSRRLWGRGLNWAFYLGVRIGAGGASKKVSKMDEANRGLEEVIYGNKS